jgi:Bacterial regulatory proteins, luxR family
LARILLCSTECWFEEALASSFANIHAVSLTQRESQILSLVSRGFKNKEIADVLSIAEPTLKTYVSRPFRKVGPRIAWASRCTGSATESQDESACLERAARQALRSGPAFGCPRTPITWPACARTHASSAPSRDSNMADAPDYTSPTIEKSESVAAETRHRSSNRRAPGVELLLRLAIAVCFTLSCLACHGGLHGRLGSLVASGQGPVPVSRPAPAPATEDPEKHRGAAPGAAAAADSHGAPPEPAVSGSGPIPDPGAQEPVDRHDVRAMAMVDSHGLPQGQRGADRRSRRRNLREGLLQPRGVGKAQGRGVGKPPIFGTSSLLFGLLLGPFLVLLWALARRGKRRQKGQRMLQPRLQAKTPTMMQIFLGPDKYGYVQCPNCNSYGRDALDPRKACALCEGWGIVPKNHRRVTEVPSRPAHDRTASAWPQSSSMGRT